MIVAVMFLERVNAVFFNKMPKELATIFEKNTM
jgi:hypothetical protein